jgi:hypothetical protein
MPVPLLGHALHVCATGAISSGARGRFAFGPNSIWPGSLGRQATWERCFESSRHSSIPGGGAAAAGGRGRKGQEAANGFLPPLAAYCSDVMSCLDLWVLSTLDSLISHKSSPLFDRCDGDEAAVHR